MAIQTRSKVDVLVAGGGPAGIIAALAASKTGARTLLIERQGYVGGIAGLAGGLPFQSFYNNRNELIVKGIPWDLITRLMSINAAFVARNAAVTGERGRGGSKFNAAGVYAIPEAFKYVALLMLREAGVDVLLHTLVTDVMSTNGVVTGVIVENKSGRLCLPAAVVIDCTGDGDVAARAGALLEKGRQGDSALQPVTPLFILSNVDIEQAEAKGSIVRAKWEVEGSSYWREHWRKYSTRLEPWHSELQEEFPKQELDGFSFVDFGFGACYCGNMIHLPGIDASDGDDLSRASAEGRVLIWRLVEFLRRRVPGFENAHLASTPAIIGARESRRIIGEYYLTSQDILEARQSADVVALCGYRVDVHGYDGGSKYHEPERGTQIKDYGSYDIPYGCLVPEKVDGLLVAGRCISGSHEAHGSYRVMGTAMALGHAAGAAAALAALSGVIPRQLSVSALQETLLCQGAHLGERQFPKQEGMKP